MELPTGSRWLAAALVALASVSVARKAAADPSAADRALAQSLFDEGRKLVDDKDYPRACPKFAESERLDPGGGTILNLALCHEAEGKTASAWTEFNESLSRAIRDGRPEREARAKERIVVLEPKLSRLTVSVASGAAADLDLTVDGAHWGLAMRGAAVPLDPGPHVIVAKTAGASPWTTTVMLGPNADAKTVHVPALGSAVATSSPPPSANTTEPVGLPQPPEPPPGTSGGGRTAGWIIGGAGVAALAVGSAFGVLALSKRSDSNGNCQGPGGCTQPGVNLNNQAITYAWVSDFGIGLGVVGVLAGVYLLVTSHGDAPTHATTSSIRVTPAALARGAGASLLLGW
jgi:hypothetical protein